MRVKLIQCGVLNVNNRMFNKENLLEVIGKRKEYPLYTEELEKRNFDKWNLSPFGKVSNLHFEGDMLVGDVDVNIQKHLDVVSCSVGNLKGDLNGRMMTDVKYIDCFYTTPNSSWDFKSIDNDNLMETE